MKSVLQRFSTRTRRLVLRNQFELATALGFWLLSGLFTVLSATAEPLPCRAATHEGNHYTICEADLRRQAVRLFWKKFDGQPYGYLASLPRSLDERSGHLLFATNAGMFHPDYSPVGLYIENGRQLVRANAKSGYGNFHMKPNGIFYVGGQSAGVLETGAFLKQSPHVEFATQSGPLLVINGRLHPRFLREGGSRKYRNGVGVRDASAVVFAISEDEVSFGSFARLFRDRLKCTNALFLDGGTVPTLYSPILQRPGNLLPLGPMVGVYERDN
jgi:uncharacterized protein YigE (DUF2233 family)